MIKKLIVLGIDGMDLDVVRRYEKDLPTISGLMAKNPGTRLRSVFPADTTPAWSTIYLGVDPSVHGVINFVNVGAKDNTYKPLVFDDSVFKGKTFWDVLAREGVTSSIVLPMNIKEGWEVPGGVMITRPNPKNGHIKVWPESKRSIYEPREDILGTEGKFTNEAALKDLKQEFFDKVKEEARLTKLAIENEECDVLFSYFSTTDGIQHDFWRHCNPSHPGYPGRNEHEDTIKEMYAYMDRFIAEVMKMQPGVPVLVLSDHGHGARPVKTARVNEILRQGGYLSPKVGTGPSTSAKKRAKKALKGAAVGIVKNVGLPRPMMKLAKKFPLWKGLFASGNDFDWGKTKAYLSDLSALKNYSYGGIRISEWVEDKDSLSDEIIAYLQTVKKPDGEPLFEWISRTNRFYHGTYLNKYPEIIFQMDELYGGEWELGENVFGDAGFMHELSPGGHRWRTAVLFGAGIKLEPKQYEMTEVCPLILELVRGAQ